MRYSFFVHRHVPRWRLVLAESGTFPERTSPDQWQHTRDRAEADINPDVRAAVQRDGYCLFTISASFDDLDRDLRPATEDPPPKLSADCRAAVNHFVYSMANGLLGYPVLESEDYRPVLMEEASAAEQATAIFCNVLELDADGSPVNVNAAETRAAQYIRAYCDRSYEADPPFEDWELDRPQREGTRLGPMP